MTVPMWPKKRAKVRAIARLLGSLNGERCLCIGSADGRTCEALRTGGGRWTHVSTDGSAPRLEAAAGRFDAVVLADVLEHITEDRLLVRTAAGCVRPGGRFVAAAPVPLPGSWARLSRAVGLTDADFGHRRPGYTPDAFRRLVADAGLTVESVRTLGGAVDELLELAANAILARLHGGAGAEAPALPMETTWRGLPGTAAGALGRLVAAASLLDRLPGMNLPTTVVVGARKGGRG